jgi:probable rRNA maturation factor
VCDPTIRELNFKYRGKNKATDVLSFSSPDKFPGNLDSLNLGDIVISIPTAAKYAAKKGYSLDMELVVLLVHGILHLAGFDHENVDQDTAKMMLNIQEQLLGEVFQNGRS